MTTQDVETIQSTSSKPSSRYVPEVGDVVEIRLHQSVKKAIVYKDERGLVTMDEYGFWNEVKYQKILQKICEVDTVKDISDVERVRSIAKAYFTAQAKPKPYAERQAAWVKANGIKVGSKVNMVSNVVPDQDGSDCMFSHRGDTLVYSVKDVTSRHIDIGNNIVAGWHVPYSVLEPVN